VFIKKKSVNLNLSFLNLNILVITNEGEYQPEFHPAFPFFLSASTAATHIFTAPACTTTIITVKPCALNAEFRSSHTEIYNKISLLCEYH
jgi:hypothetical protein